MATFAALAGVKLPEKDREGQPMIFDSFDMSPLLFGTGKTPAQTWFYFTENELFPEPCACTTTSSSSICAATTAPDGRSRGRHQPRLEGCREVCSNGSADLRPLAGSAGALRHLHEQLHRRTWMAIYGAGVEADNGDLRQYPPRKVQGYGYAGPITLSNYESFQGVREALEKQGISIPMPTGN